MHAVATYGTQRLSNGTYTVQVTRVCAGPEGVAVWYSIADRRYVWNCPAKYAGVVRTQLTDLDLTQPVALTVKHVRSFVKLTFRTLYPVPTARPKDAIDLGEGVHEVYLQRVQGTHNTLHVVVVHEGTLYRYKARDNLALRGQTQLRGLPSKTPISMHLTRVGKRVWAEFACLYLDYTS